MSIKDKLREHKRIRKLRRQIAELDKQILSAGWYASIGSLPDAIRERGLEEERDQLVKQLEGGGLMTVSKLIEILNEIEDKDNTDVLIIGYGENPFDYGCGLSDKHYYLEAKEGTEAPKHKELYLMKNQEVD